MWELLVFWHDPSCHLQSVMIEDCLSKTKKGQTVNESISAGTRCDGVPGLLTGKHEVSTYLKETYQCQPGEAGHKRRKEFSIPREWTMMVCMCFGTCTIDYPQMYMSYFWGLIHHLQSPGFGCCIQLVCVKNLWERNDFQVMTMVPWKLTQYCVRKKSMRNSCCVIWVICVSIGREETISDPYK